MMMSTWRANKEIQRFLQTVQGNVDDPDQPMSQDRMLMLAGVALGLGVATQFNSGSSQMDASTWLQDALDEADEVLKATQT